MEYTCGTFFVSKDNKLLICHPTNAPKNSWSIPKGLRDKDESSLDAAIRELKEETGIMVGQVILIDECHVYKTGKKTLIPHYHKSEIDSIEYKLVCSSIVKLKDREFPEVDRFDWVTIEDAKKVLHDTQVKCLNKIEKLLITPHKKEKGTLEAKEFS